MTIKPTMLAPALFVAMCSLLTVCWPTRADSSPEPVAADPQTEAANLRRRALAGDPVAAMRLGESLLDRAEQNKMPETLRAKVTTDGEGFLAFAAQAGHVPAMWALAERHQTGRGLPVSPERARTWLLQLAKTGDPEAHWRLYVMSSEKLLDQEGIHHLRLAAQAGHGHGLKIYFERLEQGDVLPDDPDGGLRDLALARTHNIPISDRLKELLTPRLPAPTPVAPTSAEPTPAATEPALAELGAKIAEMQTHVDELLGETRTLRDELRQRDQQQVDPSSIDFSESKPPIEAGAADYQRGLEALHNRDPVLARKRFTAAAKSGHSGARNNLGLMLLRGLGGPVEPKTAIALLQQAAEAGSASAAESLAAAYHYGIGVVADRQRALGWYELAATRGSAPARVGLQRLAAAQTHSTP